MTDLFLDQNSKEVESSRTKRLIGSGKRQVKDLILDVASTLEVWSWRSLSYAWIELVLYEYLLEVEGGFEDDFCVLMYFACRFPYAFCFMIFMAPSLGRM
jgi:hypothetical protein